MNDELSIANAENMEKPQFLIIEDDECTGKLLQRKIQQTFDNNCVLTLACDLKSAIQHLQKKSYDLITIDLDLPDSQGLKSIRRIKKYARATPIIVISADESKQLGLKTIREGAQDFISKSDVESHILKRVLSYSIERVSLQSKLHEQLIELKNWQNRFRVIIESNADAILIVSNQGIILFANPSAELLLGHQYDELIGSRLDFPYDEGMEKAELKNPQRGKLYIDSRVSDIDWDGEPAYLLSLRDATRRYQLGEKLRQAQKMESVGNLAAGIAHEFNNLLTVILGYGRMAYNECSENSLLKTNIEKIIHAGEQASSLTRQILAFSRKQMQETSTLNVNHVVQQAIAMLSKTLGEHIKLRSKLHMDAGFIEADSTQLEQILLNLSINARDAMPHGGTLTIATQAFKPDSAYIEKHPGVKSVDYAKITVTDTGCGMSEEVKRQTFDPFFSTKDLNKGTGLGLFMVYGIIKQSQGHIFLQSEINKGTEFTLLFPQVGAPVSEENKAVPEVGKGDETVLVVEDEDGVRELAVTFLELAGYRVLQAKNGEDALRLIEQQYQEIALILSDAVMPNMGGIELAKRIREQYSDLKFLLMTGFTKSADGDELSGNIPTIYKPFKFEELTQKIREVLDD